MASGAPPTSSSADSSVADRRVAKAHRPGTVRSRRDSQGGRGRCRLRRDRRRGEDEAGRHRDVHDLRVLARHRGHMVGQHLPWCRGRRRLAPVLVLVQAARLDPHPRQAGRAAEVPRGDRRRVRAAPAPAAGGGRRVGDVGRRPPRLGRPARRRNRRRMQRAAQRRRLSQRPPVPRVAGAGGLRGPGVPHRPVGARARPDRQGRGRRRHRFVRHPDRSGHPADREAPVRVPAGAGVGAGEGRA